MKSAIATLASILPITASHALAQRTPVEVSKTSGFSCCVAWMEHIEDRGFVLVGKNLAMESLMRLRSRNGVSGHRTSCHTALVDGYGSEGRGPARETCRLLDKRSDAASLSVSDMSLGSPGMDQGLHREAYDVVLSHHAGLTEVFASYPAGRAGMGG